MSCSGWWFDLAAAFIDVVVVSKLGSGGDGGGLRAGVESFSLVAQEMIFNLICVR